MKKYFPVVLSAVLLALFPAAVPAASEPSYESEQNQAVIGPPAQPSTEANLEEASAGPSLPEESSGVDWDSANTSNRPSSGSNGLIVVIDPGHQGSWVDMSAQEPMAPGSSQTKPKASTGTQGVFSGVPEYEVNLQVSLALEKTLTERGYQVVMTRTDNDTAISNKERAELATAEGADITVRIHANGDGSSQAAGALTMAPTSANAYLEADVIEKSNTLASCILNHYCAATGLGNLGVISADSMTGTNWSTVPVAILEMGFMTNQNDDLYITDTENHELMARSVADGIDEYFSLIADAGSGE